VGRTSSARRSRFHAVVPTLVSGLTDSQSASRSTRTPAVTLVGTRFFSLPVRLCPGSSGR
jgi:hypothetical protein